MSDRSTSQQAFSGLVPKFFQSAPNAPEIEERLLHLARELYLENPMPSLFKERLLYHYISPDSAKFATASPVNAGSSSGLDTLLVTRRRRFRPLPRRLSY